MEVKSDVLTITKLSDYFFVVPDYQREYVWKAEDHVEYEGRIYKLSPFVGTFMPDDKRNT